MIEKVLPDALVLSFTFDTDPSAPYPLSLLIGFPRPICTKRILKDLTTLGVASIHLVATELGEKSYRDSRIWKNGEYLQPLKEGAEQAHSTRIPEVSFHHSLKASFTSLPPETDLIALDNIENDFRLSQYRPRKSGALLAIGSERGWSDRDRTREALRSSADGALRQTEVIL